MDPKQVIPTWNSCRIPPCVCRLLAKSKGADGQERLMTDAELRQRTGWTRYYLSAVYHSATWDKVEVADMDLFLWACGLHPSKQRRYIWLLKRAWSKGMDGIRNMRHLKVDVSWRIVQIDILLQMVEKVLGKVLEHADE